MSSNNGNKKNKFIEGYVNKFVINDDVDALMVYNEKNDKWAYYKLKLSNNLSKEFVKEKPHLASLCTKYVFYTSLLNRFVNNDKSIIELFSTSECWYGLEIDINDYTDDEILTLYKAYRGKQCTAEWVEKYKKYNFKKYKKVLCDAIFSFYLLSKKKKYE